jgi:hypothetical protein
MANGSKGPSLPALPTHTSVTCWVEDDNSRPVPLASVHTNINGVDVALGNSKTDWKGKVFWMWPNQGVSAPQPSDTYSGLVWASKGKKGSAREKFSFHKAKHHQTC